MTYSKIRFQRHMLQHPHTFMPSPRYHQTHAPHLIAGFFPFSLMPLNRFRGSFPFNYTNICLSQHTVAQTLTDSANKNLCARTSVLLLLWCFCSSGADERKLNIPNMIIITAFIVRPHQGRTRSHRRRV